MSLVIQAAKELGSKSSSDWKLAFLAAAFRQDDPCDTCRSGAAETCGSCGACDEAAEAACARPQRLAGLGWEV